MAHPRETFAHAGNADTVRPDVPEANASMNITPMIDVLLVLLVIFMAALPLSQRGLDVNLPAETRKADAAPPADTQIVLEYTGDRQLSINKQDVTPQDLPARLRTIFDERRDKTLFIVGDAGLRYADIVFVIDAAKGAGVQKVGVVTAGMRRAAM